MPKEIYIQSHGLRVIDTNDDGFGPGDAIIHDRPHTLLAPQLLTVGSKEVRAFIRHYLPKAKASWSALVPLLHYEHHFQRSFDHAKGGDLDKMEDQLTAAATYARRTAMDSKQVEANEAFVTEFYFERRVFAARLLLNQERWSDLHRALARIEHLLQYYPPHSQQTRSDLAQIRADAQSALMAQANESVARGDPMGTDWALNEAHTFGMSSADLNRYLHLLMPQAYQRHIEKLLAEATDLADHGGDVQRIEELLKNATQEASHVNATYARKVAVRSDAIRDRMWANRTP